MSEPMAGDERGWIVAVVLLTFTTGLADAASVLGLGHVFTGNMTGNVLFLGFSLARAHDVSIVASSVAVAAFVSGAGAGARIVRAPRGCVPGFAVELALLGAAVALAASGAHRPMRDYALLILLAGALGIQGAVARDMRAVKVSTVVLTSTLIAATADLGTDGARAQRIAAIAAMLSGAVTGALLLRHGLHWPIGLGTVLVALVLALSARRPPRPGLR